MPHRSAWRNLDTLAVLKRERPAGGIFTDIDGTLSEIVRRPEQAAISPRMRATLGKLAERFSVVALVSGRSAAEARRLLRLRSVVYVGNHGLELVFTGDGSTTVTDGEVLRLISLARVELDPRVARVEGVRLEDKGLSLALHYREAADPASARAALMRLVEPVARRHSLRITEGRKVVELRPPAANKGRAVEALVRRYGLKALLYIGDDQTDVDAFRAVRRLRDEGLAGYGIAVASDETPAQVEGTADFMVASVSDVERLLAWLVED